MSLCFTHIEKEEAAWLLDKRKSNNVRLYVMNHSVVISRHESMFNHGKFETLLNNATRFVHYHYNDNPDCGRQVTLELVAINEFGFSSGIKVIYEVEIEKIIPFCNLDNKDLQD